MSRWTAAHEAALQRARHAVDDAVEATRASEVRIRIARAGARHCTHCNRPMPFTRRVDALFCSKACNTAHWQKAHRKAGAA